MIALHIDRTGNWRSQWGPKPLPTDWEPLGTVTDTVTGETGALLRAWPAYLYVQGNNGAVLPLCQHDVHEALDLEEQKCLLR